MSDFDVYGPADIPVIPMSQGRNVNREGLTDFWKEHGEISEKYGCYVFAIRTSSNFVPIYVGKASKTFKQECFTAHKRADHYNPALGDYLRGSPVMFFLVQTGSKNTSEIKDLEEFLIQVGVATNQYLSNIKGTKQSSWTIRGVIRSGPGKPSESSKIFKKMMKLNSRR